MTIVWVQSRLPHTDVNTFIHVQSDIHSNLKLNFCLSGDFNLNLFAISWCNTCICLFSSFNNLHAMQEYRYNFYFCHSWEHCFQLFYYIYNILDRKRWTNTTLSNSITFEGLQTGWISTIIAMWLLIVHVSLINEHKITKIYNSCKTVQTHIKRKN